MDLVERAEPLVALHQAMARVIRSHGEIVLVAGEAGVGKTALLREFVRTLPAAARFAWGGCDALITPRPLGPLIDMAPELGSTFRASLRDSSEMFDVFGGLLDAIQEFSGGIALVFEDAHWADNATLDLLNYVCRRLFGLKVLIVISYRSNEVGPGHPLTSLIGNLPSRLVNRLTLECLSPAGVAALAAPFGRSGEQLHRLTGGNPFFVTELLSHPATTDRTLPESIKASIYARLAKLAKPDLRVMQALSIVPHGVQRDLFQLINLEFGQAPLSAEQTLGLLVEMPDQSIRFRHELARLAVFSSLDPAQQRGFARRLLDLLATHTDLVDTHLDLAAHCAEAADDDGAIMRFTPRAGRRAARLGAHREAAAHFASALRYVDQLPIEDGAQLYEDWAYEAGIADEISDAVIAARHSAIALWRKVGRWAKMAHNYRCLWRLHWYRAETQDAEDAIRIALDCLHHCDPCAELGMAYSTVSQVHFLNNRAREAIELGHRALDIARQFGDIATQVHAMTNIGSALLSQDDAKGARYLEDCLALARKHNLHEHAARVFTNYSEFAMLRGDLELAESLTSEGIAFDTSHTLDSWTYYLVGRQAQLRVEQGRLRDAIGIARGVVAIDKLTTVMRLPALIALARALARTGARDAGDALNEALAAAERVKEPQYLIPAKLAIVEHAYLALDFSTALTRLGEVASYGRDKLQPWDRSAVALWAHRLDADLPADIVCKPGSAAALEISGDVLGAAQLLQQGGQPFDAALARMHYLGSGQDAELSAALAAMEEMEAMAGSTYGRSIAQARGLVDSIPRRRRGPYSAARSHPLGLTARELEVLRMIVDGYSNKDIADRMSRSQRTVENHVSAILIKLNASNRLQAALRVVSEPWLLDIR